MLVLNVLQSEHFSFSHWEIEYIKWRYSLIPKIQGTYHFATYTVDGLNKVSISKVKAIPSTWNVPKKSDTHTHTQKKVNGNSLRQRTQCSQSYCIRAKSNVAYFQLSTEIVCSLQRFFGIKHQQSYVFECSLEMFMLNTMQCNVWFWIIRIWTITVSKCVQLNDFIRAIPIELIRCNEKFLHSFFSSHFNRRKKK